MPTIIVWVCCTLTIPTAGMTILHHNRVEHRLKGGGMHSNVEIATHLKPRAVRIQHRSLLAVDPHRLFRHSSPLGQGGLPTCNVTLLTPHQPLPLVHFHRDMNTDCSQVVIAGEFNANPGFGGDEKTRTDEICVE